MTAPSLTSHLTKALPWLFALPVLALGITSFAGQEFGRLWLLFPSLLAVLLTALCLTQKNKPDLPAYVLGTALLFIGTLAANTVFNHSELVTPAFRNTLIMLVLPWGLLLAGMVKPQMLLQNTRPLLLSLLVLEALLVGQLWYSYIIGWGEVYDSRDGIRRAYGAAGDSYTAVLVFILLLNFIRLKAVRFALGFTALLMSGGKMGLIILALGIAFALPTMSLSRDNTKRIALLLLLTITFGFGVTSAYVRAIIMPEQVAHIATSTAPPPEMAEILAQEAPESPKLQQDIRNEWAQRSLPTHLVEGIISTGEGRIISLGAALTMFSHNPLTGVGYGQSANQSVFQAAVAADVFKLVERYNVHPTRLSAEKFIGNQSATIAAEQGLLGLIPFALFCLMATLLTAKVWLQLKANRTEQTPARALVAAASIWSFCLIIFNQTAPWLLSGACMTIWLALTLGICAPAYRQQTAHG